MENIECEVPILFSCARGVGQLTGVALDQGAYDLPSAEIPSEAILPKDYPQSADTYGD